MSADGRIRRAERDGHQGGVRLREDCWAPFVEGVRRSLERAP